MLPNFQQWPRIPIRFPGIPPEILINYSGLIQQLVKEGKLIPISKMESVRTRVMAGPQPEPPTLPVKTTALSIPLSNTVDWWWKYGGIRAPHLHYGEEVYTLNETQWQAFSSTVLRDVAKKLNRAKNIGFDQFVNVANATNEIA